MQLTARLLYLSISLVNVLNFLPSDLQAQSVDFNKQIRPLLSNRCLACHGPDEGQREAGLQLDLRESATTPRESGDTAVVPGDPQNSTLIARLTSADPDIRMPPPEFSAPLTAEEIDLFRRWIQQGADYATHWSWAAPQRPQPPTPSGPHADWPANPVDQFLLHSMQQRGLQPSAQAAPETLIRRVFLDLTGLPPTTAELEHWLPLLQQNHADNWSRLVDHLLQKPEYGEHWGRRWLDLARYADSAGYADDPARTIWAYRDWVIRALNSDMSFAQFTVEQLAGDLLPNPTNDQLIATAFHRNTMTNNEGGTQDEEFRNAAIVDRVNTTMAVWMGTTIACAQCHSHKYDAITQQEYFQLFALLNNTADADRRNEEPILSLFTPDEEQRKSELQQQVEQLDLLLSTPTAELAASQKLWEEQLLLPMAWTSVTPATAVRASQKPLQIGQDGILRTAEPAAKDTLTLDLPLSDFPRGPNGSALPAALQIETLPSTDLPGNGAGHGGGNFVISELRAMLIPPGNAAPKARYVRIDIPGDDRILSLAEVQVLASGSNIAPAGTATQSSTDFNGPPQLAIDGRTDGNFQAGSVTHTAISKDPWWEVDLGSAHPIDSIVIHNRTDNNLHTRLVNFRLQLLDEQRSEIWQQTVTEAPSPSAEYSPSSIRPLTFADVAADWEQDGFPASEVLDGKTEADNGWAVGGQVDQPHQLILVPQQVQDVPADSILRLVIEHQAPYENHVLGQFRISGTDSASAIARARVPAAMQQVIQTPHDQRTDDQQGQLADFYRRSAAAELKQERQQLQAAQQELNGIKPGTSVPVMEELAAENSRRTFFQYRGNYLDRGDEVTAGFPAAFPQPSADQPLNRLTLAKWLVDPANPLTARVVANRFWEDLFGVGIVASSEEFGSQGELPSHPELLDWLAIELTQNAWNTRALLRLLVTSSAYQQSSVVTAELLEADPANRWLARGPRVRLTAEMVRDQALSVAGLLSRKMYGPPVRPPRPSMGLSAAFGSSTDWQPSSGDDRYRRAVYTTWRRSNPYPSMATFDSPNRETCTLKRNRTNTPLQALVTMNDEVYVEAAQAFARRILQSSETLEEQIRFALRTALCRDATAAEVQQLQQLFQDSLGEFADSPEAAMQLATQPLGALPEGMQGDSAAAMTIVASVILNLDEMLMKR